MKPLASCICALILAGNAGPIACADESHPTAWAQADGTRLSQLIGATVVSSDQENVGVVDDLMLNPNGQVSGLVIGLAGALAVGEKDVALPFSKVSVLPNRSAEASSVFRDGLSFGTGRTRVLLDASTKELVSAPSFVARKGGTGVPSPSAGQPESVTKEPKSSTRSGGPG